MVPPRYNPPMRTLLPLLSAATLFVCVPGATPVSAQDSAPATPSAKAGSAKPPQHQVAAKDIVFKEATAIDAASSGALGASDLDGLRKREGKETTVSGKVVTVFTPESRSIVLLNFARNYREAVVVGVKANRFSAFPDLRQLKDKTVLVTGPIVLYKDRPEILVESPSQIRIVRSQPEKK